VGTTALGWTLVGVLAAGFLAWALLARPWDRDEEELSSNDEAPVPVRSAPG
jgi:hypothetical protein